MHIERVDHFVLTVASIENTCRFYETVLGMEVVAFAGGRTALAFGKQKINLHQQGAELLPRAKTPTPGSGDFCLIAKTPMEDIIRHIESCGVEIEEGPTAKTGAIGPISSVYIRDPDFNLVEVSVYSTVAK